MRVLAVNAGSSSLKAALFDVSETERLVASAEVERIGADSGFLEIRDSDGAGVASRDLFAGDHASAARAVLQELTVVEPEALAVVGHRIVHGGASFIEPTWASPDVLDGLRAIVALDPVHLPPALSVLDVLREAVAAPQVVCFDTAFHRTMPRAAQLFPLPLELFAAGIRRYGFHGLSYESVLEQLHALSPSVASGRVVAAHLGSGASLAAIREGRCLETTMGFTPAGGVVMGTRPGDLDPGVLVHLARSGASPEELDDLINRRSGLLGLSERSGDMRDLLAHEEEDDRAADAIAVFCHRARMAIGGLAAALGGLDTLVFTGGIGERAPSIRARISTNLAHLGVILDADANEAGGAVISSTESRVRVYVLRADEERVIARHAAEVIRREEASATGAQPTNR